MRHVLALLLLLLFPGAARAQVPPTGIPPGWLPIVALHDIVDSRDELDTDAITASSLVSFFDWLKHAGWTPVTLDDIAAAGEGRRALPPKPVLLTFDDGYRSFRTRLMPLLRAYRYPVVVALVGAWMEGAPGGSVMYGDRLVPRSRFITWAEAREMQASGLVEFASHSYGLHSSVQGNPQGNQLPAAAAWAYDPATGRYEDDAALQARVERDLRRAMEMHRRELGRAPRALVWPFGRYVGPSLAAARRVGFRFALTLDPQPADPRTPMALARFYPSQAPEVASIVDNLRFRPDGPPALRLVCADGTAVAGAADQDAALGKLIESVRTLGANMAVLDAHLPGEAGRLGAALYPTALLPRGPDVLNRMVWQVRTRGGVEVFVRIDLAAAAASVSAERVAELVADIVRMAPGDGLLLENAGALAAAVAEPAMPDPLPWMVRARRAALDPATLDMAGRLALEVFRRVEALRPGLRLMLRAGGAPEAGLWPAPAADLVLTAAPVPPLARTGWIAPAALSRVLVDAASVPALRAAQRAGATGLAFCADGPAALAQAAVRARDFSSATFPLRP
jgi:peptidoglycan/xylan/chitin deacetylase (PgdA/CDA1 family)